ncbi:ankyrin repeat-containing protein BDA1 [Trifolium repens]|nr:ankyrin repeat-containing protein BDA1 [Trifolium repens]
MSNLDILRPAAEEGNIDLLYNVLKNNPSILEDIDSEQLVETPLHIAATKGHIPFATEIMNWKPSFALKLNPEGLSPIHLAIQNKRMMLCFIGMNKDLVRVKGKGGRTPLHLASEIGDVAVLNELLHACPNSLEDVTVWGDTALHIAAKNNNYDALHLLVFFLRNNKRRGSGMLEYKVLRQKDNLDNTILHISVENKIPKEIIQLLIKSKYGRHLNAKNSESKTALDMATDTEIIKLLSSAGAKYSSKLSNSKTLSSKHKPIITMWDEVEIYISRLKNIITEEQRSTSMIILTLIITATYQSVLSPPGGFYQANASDNNVNITASSNSTISSVGTAGKSVLSIEDFFMFSYFSMFSFLMSTIIIIIITPRGKIAFTTLSPMLIFTMSYVYSMWKISPTNFNYIVVGVFFIIIGVIFLIIYAICVYSRLQRRLNARILYRSPLLQSNTEIDTNNLTVEIGERNRNEGLSRDI